jgi:hypothetical protein
MSPYKYGEASHKQNTFRLHRRDPGDSMRIQVSPTSTLILLSSTHCFATSEYRQLRLEHSRNKLMHLQMLIAV